MEARLRAVPAAEPEEDRVAEPLGFEAFFGENRTKLFGALCLVTGNRHEAEEIAQDAFLKLWERWDRVSTLEDPTSFLFRTAMNVFRNRLRRAGLGMRKALALVPSTTPPMAGRSGTGIAEPDLGGARRGYRSKTRSLEVRRWVPTGSRHRMRSYPCWRRTATASGSISTSLRS
jgi:DNA-directed RNA polymerase specialized sigma24 family protein